MNIILVERSSPDNHIKYMTFNELGEASLEMFYKIVFDLNELSDFSIAMDIIEQQEFFTNLMLGAVEELNGYDISFDRESMTYIRSDIENQRYYELFIETIK